MTASNAFPSGFVPFTSIYSVSAPDANGNRLVVGSSTVFNYLGLASLSTSSTNQEFSNNEIELAPGQYFSNVYMPTADELEGNFSAVAFPVFDPLIGLPFPGNIIPASRIGDPFAFLIGPPTPASAALDYMPVTPCRLADTRTAAGPFGAPFITGNSSRSLVISSSSCSIPTTASAYSLNVTVVPHGGLSYLTVWPTGQTQPLVSTLNSADGRVKANAAIVPAVQAGL